MSYSHTATTASHRDIIHQQRNCQDAGQQLAGMAAGEARAARLRIADQWRYEWRAARRTASQHGDTANANW